MGVYYSTYVGPVLSISAEQVEVKKVRTACPKGHPVDKADKFCATCGSPTFQEGYTESRDFNMYDFCYDNDLDEDLFYKPEYIDVYLCNKGDVGVSLDCDACESIDISSEYIDTEMDKAKSDDDIKKLLAALDAEGIVYELKFMVVGYAS